MEIRFTTGQSPLGRVLVAATDRGICNVSLRESDEGAVESLRARFLKAKIHRDDVGLKPALDLVLARIAGRQLEGALPLDLQGTEFQRDVWKQLLAIPAHRRVWRFRRVRRARTWMSHRPSTGQRRRAQSHRRVGRTRSRWSFPVTAS
jgi:hypothetical protein